MTYCPILYVSRPLYLNKPVKNLDIMLFDFEKNTQFFCYCNSVDMRKGIHSLYGLIKSSCGASVALNGNAYLFIGKNRRSIKVLMWHKDGFILYHKKLELGCYSLPKRSSGEVFFPLDLCDFERMINLTHYKSMGNELRKHIMLNL